MKVPGFLLRRLYVRGSLRNLPDGWAFTIRNSIAGGEATGLDPLAVDGRPVPAERTYFHVDGRAVSFDSVDEDHRFGLAVGNDIDITVQDEPLPPGSHTITMAFTVPAIGTLAFDFTDIVA